MKRLVNNKPALVLLCVLLGFMVNGLVANVTGWNINRRPTSDWFSGNNNYRNVPLMSMRAADKLLAGGLGLGTGKIWYFDSNQGTAITEDGRSWLSAYDTIEECVVAATADGGADRGDVILCAQGSTLALGAAADEVDLDMSGLTLKGCGHGTLRPLMDFTGDVTGAFAVGAANIVIENFVFKANITDVNEAIEVESAGDNLTIRNCDFIVEAGGTDEFLNVIAVADTANSLRVEGCYINMKNGASNHAIFFDADVVESFVTNTIIVGDYAVANVKGDEANDYQFFLDNDMINGTLGGDGELNDQPVIELANDSSGYVRGNFLSADTATNHLAMTVFDDGLFMENFSTDDDGDDNEGTQRSGTAAVTASADG